MQTSVDLAAGSGDDSAQSAQSVPSAEEAVVNSLMSIGRLMKVRGQNGLDPSTMHFLHTLRCNPAVRITDLAALLRLDVSTVSRHVQSLEKSGLVVRHPHPDDGRAQAVDLTDLGHHDLDRAVAARRALLTDLLSHWDRGRIEQLAELLTAFTHDVENRTTELEQS